MGAFLPNFQLVCRWCVPCVHSQESGQLISGLHLLIILTPFCVVKHGYRFAKLVLSPFCNIVITSAMAL